MSIKDFISDYNANENVYNNYISELEEASKSKNTQKCQQVFESCRKQLQDIPPSVTSGAPSIEQVDKLVSVMKEQLHQKTRELAQHIISSDLNLKDPGTYQDFSHALRLEILKAYRDHTDYIKYPLLDMLKAYGITDQNELCEIAEAVAAQSGFEISEIISGLGITDEANRVKIAKIGIATETGTAVCEKIKNYGITDENSRFEIAKIIAANNGAYWISHFIKDYKITDEKKRFEVAKIAFSKFGYFPTYDIPLSDYLHNYELTDREMLYQLAKIHAKSDPAGLIKIFFDYQISNEDERFEIVKIAAAGRSVTGKRLMTGADFVRFDLKDPNHVVEALAVIAPGDLMTQVEYARPLAHLDLVKWSAIVQILIANWGWEPFKRGVSNLRTLSVLEATNLDDGKKLILMYHCLTVLATNAETPDDFNDLGGFTGWLTTSDLEIPLPLKEIPADHMRWISKLCHLEIPQEFESAAEEEKAKKELDASFAELKRLAVRPGMPEMRIDPVLSRIKERNSLLQQKKDLLWLGVVMTQYARQSESPFSDKKGISVLEAIWKVTEPTLRERATNALIDVYESPEKIKLLGALLNEKKEYLHLVVLSSVQAGIDQQAMTAMLDELAVRYYKDTRVITPIIEMLQALSISPLSVEERQKLLKIVFNPPEKGAKESSTSFTQRLAKYREDQTDCISAIHSLLYFGQGPVLKTVQDAPALLTAWKTFMGNAFHVNASSLSKFMTTFSKSPRYPNGLITYAARLQTLPNEQKDVIMPLLGKFASAVLDGAYPQIRYDFAENPHLETLFSENKELLKIWQTPIKIEQSAQGQVEDEPPQEQIQRVTRRALGDRHLGEDQELVYPGLKDVLAGEPTVEMPPNPAELEKKRIEVVQKCAVILNPKSDLSQLKEALNDLLKLLPADVEFRKDVSDMLKQLASRASHERWTIEDSDAWEDMVLMGTETDNSCQNINGNPALNKCLLSYILDGKTRIMVARDPSGKIVGRAVMRVLEDKIRKKPALFVERLYIRGGNYQSKEQDILAGCRQKAEAMGIPLVASARDYYLPEAKKYPGSLDSLGGPVPFEYVDALGGVQPNGVYSIPKSILLWSPLSA